MKLNNTTDYPDWFLRRMVAWCCRQSKLPVRRMRRADFRNTRRSYSGLAYGRWRFSVRIGDASRFPYGPDDRPGMGGEIFADRTEALVAVTAHELEHCCQMQEGRIGLLDRKRALERVTRAHEVRTLRLFREQRETLLAAWMQPPARAVKAPKPKPTRAERNEANARKQLAKWERAAKRAQTHLRKWRAKVRRYDRIAATRPPG